MGDPAADPRPLVGEPVGVDLLNTVWRDEGVEHDLLATADGLEVWLTTHGFDGAAGDESLHRALVAARGALRAHVDGLLAPPVPPSAVAALDRVLGHGRLARGIGERGPETRVVVADPAWLPAWTAAEDYLRLLERDPDRLRRCAHPDCVLHFYDTSKRGDRRWCSMSACGNRAKAARHYARTREVQPAT